MAVTLAELAIADSADAWTQAGFTTDADVCRVGSVGLRLGAEGRGIAGWALAGLESDGVCDIDGVPTTSAATIATGPVAHPNGVIAIDHVVLLSPNLGRTVEAFAAIGVAPRRERDAELGGRAVRQIFFRLGEVILEVVGALGDAGAGPSTLWGVTFTVADVDATAAFLGEHTTPVKDAVQPGRRITTLRHREVGMSVPTAFISASR